MGNLMRCIFCGLLQDEPVGVKTCDRCGGELVFEKDRIKAFSGESADNLDMLKDKAKEWGAKTRYSAVQVSDAMAEFALKGLKALF